MSYNWIAILCVSGLLFFAKGFFPVGTTIPGFGEFHISNNVFEDESGSPQFDRLILMVVDAMRSDFMFSELSDMTFLHTLIRKGAALPFTAYSNPPTVTLPRLKGITTGSAPNFVDAILNIADDKDSSQSLALQDSWLHQFKHQRSNRSIHFFGDDTWLKLFPPDNFFDRFEGTSSFFVKDFTEVDNNVTRHLTSIESSSWDGLILHYLGMDHIGHLGGPFSPHMQPKQREMDLIIRQLYEAQVQDNDRTLLVVMGDHGMNDVGNHGGASNGETHPGMVFISPKLVDVRGADEKFSPLPCLCDYKYHQFIDQIDLVPSLAALFGFPIPKNSLGKLIPDFLKLWGKDRRKQILMENCEQIYSLLAAQVGHESISRPFKTRLDELRAGEHHQLVDYFNYLEEVQARVVKAATNYSITFMLSGFILTLGASIWIFIKLFIFTGPKEKNDWLFLPFCLIYALHFHGSSLIEEEHQIWWFLLQTVLGIYSFLNAKFLSVDFAGLLMALRVLRAWSNSGQKYQTKYTIGGFLKAHNNLLWCSVLMTYFYMFLRYRSHKVDSADTHSFIKSATCLTSVVFSVIFKSFQSFLEESSVPDWVNSFIIDFAPEMASSSVLLISNHLSNAFFCLILIIAILDFKDRKVHGSKYITDLKRLLVFTLMHQSRVEIIPMFAFLEFAASSLDNISLKIIGPSAYLEASLFLCLQNFSFFAIGNTNLIATVDLSNSYNGLLSYNILLVAVMTFIANFAPVIFWSLCDLQHMKNLEKSAGSLLEHFKQRHGLSVFFYSISLLSLLASCFNLRYHLFIWSVFSPKFLYFAAWFICVNCGIDYVMRRIIIASI